MSLDDLSGIGCLIIVLVLLWWLGGAPSLSPVSATSPSPPGYDAPDPDYSSIRQYYNGPVWDHGAIRDNSVGGRARERNRRRYNDSLYGR